MARSCGMLLCAGLFLAATGACLSIAADWTAMSRGDEAAICGEDFCWVTDDKTCTSLPKEPCEDEQCYPFDSLPTTCWNSEGGYDVRETYPSASLIVVDPNSYSEYGQYWWDDYYPPPQEAWEYKCVHLRYCLFNVDPESDCVEKDGKYGYGYYCQQDPNGGNPRASGEVVSWAVDPGCPQ